MAGKLSRGNLIENAPVIVMILMNQINATKRSKLSTKRSKLPKSTNKGQYVRKLYILVGLNR
jgi:hypothetical protein